MLEVLGEQQEVVDRENVLAGEEVFTGDGVAVNSSKYDGLPTSEFKTKISADLAEGGQGREAVNFQLTMFLAAIVSALLVFVFIGIILILIVAVYSLVYTVIAGIKANEGVWYRYPFSIKFISRAPGPDA